MEGKCWFKIRSFNGGVEIGGVEGQEWDDENYVGPLRLLVEVKQSNVKAAHRKFIG